MDDSSILKPYRDRMSSIVADPEFTTLEKKYQPYLELNGFEDIFGVFDIKQAHLVKLLQANLFGIRNTICQSI